MCFPCAGAPGSARAAILNFLSACPPAELRPLLELFLEPLSNAFVRQGPGDGALATQEGGDDPDCLRWVCVCVCRCGVG